MNRKTKAIRKARLVELLNSEAPNIRHNAELRYPYSLMEGFEDQCYEELAFIMAAYIDGINEGAAGLEYIEGRIESTYGTVYTYGRNGATCAPKRMATRAGRR